MMIPIKLEKRTEGEQKAYAEGYAAGKRDAVRHARWIIHGEAPWLVVECSNCGEKWHHWSGERTNNYCGNCGAKMDEEDQPKRFWPEQVEKIMIEAIAKAITHKDTEEEEDE